MKKLLGWIVLLMSFSLPHGVACAQSAVANAPTIGSIGQAILEIPPGVAELVEYESGPSVGAGAEPGLNKEPAALESFALRLQYPTFMPATRGSRIDFRARVGVVVLAGESSGQIGSTTRIATGVLGGYVRYMKSDKLVFGLEMYRPVSSDRGTNISREPSIYIERAESGEVKSLILCHARILPTGWGKCSELFELRPKLDARIEVHFVEELLEHWAEIKQRTSHVIFGYIKVN